MDSPLPGAFGLFCSVRAGNSHRMNFGFRARFLSVFSFGWCRGLRCSPEMPCLVGNLGYLASKLFAASRRPNVFRFVFSLVWMFLAPGFVFELRFWNRWNHSRPTMTGLQFRNSYCFAKILGQCFQYWPELVWPPMEFSFRYFKFSSFLRFSQVNKLRHVNLAASIACVSQMPVFYWLIKSCNLELTISRTVARAPAALVAHDSRCYRRHRR